MSDYDSRPDTYAHIQQVQRLLGVVIRDLLTRSEVHDQSKLVDPEKATFDEFTPKLKDSTYGSDEYKEFLKGMKPALDHHYAENSHHPEHFSPELCDCVSERLPTDAADGHPRVYPHPEVTDIADEIDKRNLVADRNCQRCLSTGWVKRGIVGMSLLDLLEMLCDWKAATMRHADGDIRKSIEINQKRFGYSDELKQIMLNTLSLIEGA